MKGQKIITTWLASTLLVVQLPMAVLAQEAPPETSTTVTDPTTTTTITPAPAPAPEQTSAPVSVPENSTPPSPATGPTSPTGSDAPKYTYNPESGLWESEKYTWNPNTGQTAPKGDPGYYYNPETGRWDTNQYVYHPESGKYELASPPSVMREAANAGVGAGSLAGPTLADALSSLFGLSNSNTGPNSDNTISANSTNNGFFDLFSRMNVENNINSQATSGDATVSGNTTAGDAITGMANVASNVLSLLNSAWGWAGGALNFLAKNFWGDHTGDINLNPTASTGGGGALGNYNPLVAGNSNTGPDSTNTIDASGENNLTVVNRPTGTITNNIDLLAQSGNALVDGNTNAGNASTGDAAAVLNLLNFINSSIASGESFFGMLNFFGNLNGDVLFPDGFLTDALQGAGAGSGGLSGSNSNTGPNSTNSLNANSSNNLDITNSPQANFDNNINLAAQSGTALVQGNTTAGNALTGNASTDNNLYNLYNTSLMGQNAVLVLVNVGGKWTGQIMNLPAGSNPGTGSALLTSGATIQNSDTGPNSTNTVDANSSNDLTVENRPVGNIVNNVRAGAITGDATVSRNTNAGDASTGDARVVSNVANMFNSHLNLSGWFGILVVNVFGDWNGSVNKDTEAGESVAAVSATSLPQSSGSGGGGTTQAYGRGASYGTAGSSSFGGGGESVNQASVSANSSNLGTKVLAAKEVITQASQEAAAKTKAISTYLMIGAIFMLLGAAMYGLERRVRSRV